MQIACYPTNLTDAQWQFLKPFLPPPRKMGRTRTDLRAVVDALLYVTKGGIPWRLLPVEFPPWQTVYGFFRKWAQNHTLESLNARLRARVRAAVGKRSRPTAAILDSQSVKSDPHGGAVGYDAGKKIKGRKRHIMTDTLGLMLVAAVHSAGIQDRDGAPLVFEAVRRRFPSLHHVFADGGYAGDKLRQALRPLGPFTLQIIRRCDTAQGFVLLPRRWVVERTLAWLGRCRRLAKDWERTLESATAWAFIASIRMLSRRVARLGFA